MGTAHFPASALLLSRLGCISSISRTTECMLPGKFGLSSVDFAATATRYPVRAKAKAIAL